MRPYMLWLTRVYAGATPGDFLAAPFARCALTDWVIWQSEQRRLLEAARWR